MTAPTVGELPVHLRRPSLVAGGVLIVVIVGLALLEQVEAVRDLVVGIDAWLHRSAARWEGPPGVAVSELLSVVGGAMVTTPLRILVGVVFVVRRRWWLLGAWVASIGLMEASVTLMKLGFDRPRPPGGLVGTTMSAFPSGHAAATTVTVLTLLLLLRPPPGRRAGGADGGDVIGHAAGGPRAVLRDPWWVAGVVLVVAMAVSRVYLRAHWASDVTMGVLVGSAAALLAIGWVASLEARRCTTRRSP